MDSKSGDANAPEVVIDPKMVIVIDKMF
jgi:hypothetical protein